MEEKVYIGIKLEWDYMHKTVTFSMPSYVRSDLHGFQHIIKGGKEYSPHNCDPVQYGQKFQYAEPLYSTEYLSENETILVQQVCGTFLYYSIAINNNIIPALSNASS